MKPSLLPMLALALCPAPLAAQDATPSSSPFAPRLRAGIDAVSTYAFRGVDVTGGAAVQPWASLALGRSGLTLGAWGSWAVADRGGRVPYGDSLTRGDMDEIDLTAAVSRAAGPLALSAGYVAYVYPALGYTTQEVYAGVAVPSLPLSPGVTAYYDVDGTDDPARDPDTVEGAYVALSAAQRIELGVAVDAAGSLGWTNQAALRGDPGLNDAGLSLAVPLPAGRVTVTPAAGWARRFAGAPYADGAEDTFWARLQVTLAP